MAKATARKSRRLLSSITKRRASKVTASSFWDSTAGQIGLCGDVERDHGRARLSEGGFMAAVIIWRFSRPFNSRTNMASIQSLQVFPRT